MTVPYAYEKFMGAIASLATSARPIQERLESAYRGVHTLKADDFPAGEMRDLYLRIWGRLDGLDDKDGNRTIHALCKSLDDEAASTVAEEFLELFKLLIVADHVFYVDRVRAK